MPRYRIVGNHRVAGVDPGGTVDIDDERQARILVRGGHLAPADDTPTEPPRSGRGSGKKAWAAYAAELGVDVPADANREAIIAAVDARSSG